MLENRTVERASDLLLWIWVQWSVNVQYFIYCINYETSLNFLFPTVSVHGLPLSTSNQEYGNNIQLPLRQNLSKIQNDSRPHINITSNELSTEAIHTSTVSTHLIKTPTTNLPLTHTIGDMLGGFKSKSTDFPNVATTVRNLLGAKETTLPILTENYTTASPSASTVVHDHHFNMKILDYILIPVGCLLAIVVLYCVVSRSKLYLSIQLKKKISCIFLNAIWFFPIFFTQQIVFCSWIRERSYWTAEEDMKTSMIVACTQQLWH